MNWNSSALRSLLVVLAIFVVGYLAGIGGGHDERRDPAGLASVLITEIAASGPMAVVDEDGDHCDWIELTNLGSAPADLDGCRLTVSFKKNDPWRFPRTVLNPGQRLVVFASGKDRRASGQALHTNFKLRSKGGYLGFISADGQRVLQEFKPGYPALHGAVTYGLPETAAAKFVDGPRDQVPGYSFFVRATPGGPNAGDVVGLVDAVEASTVGRLCDGIVQVRLACPTPGSHIRYTTNGGEPSETAGKEYTAPLTIERTTVLRAAAFKPGFAPSPVLTRSLLFPARVADQTGQGFPAFWGYTNGQPVAAYYRTTAESKGVDGEAGRTQLADGLRSLPSLSIVADPAALFDPAYGIYSNPQETGRQWERAASAELVFPDGAPGFQVDCGVRIQGGWNRRPEECPKHSLRLLFKRQYGASHLEFPLFGLGGATNFQTVILRGGCNNTWLHWSGEERLRGEYLRDQWMRDTSAAMGQPAARGRFVHLYLNGLYWGLYNLAERPSAPFLAAKFGGRADDYDSRNSDKVLSGDPSAWRDLFALANGGVVNSETWGRIGGLLDVTNFADYMLLNHYGANADWDAGSNWYAGRSRQQGGRYQFYVWDGERTLEAVGDDRTDADDDQSPSRLFHKLEAFPEFKRLLAARLGVHCGRGGVLSPGVAAERYRSLAAGIDRAMLAEQARWGAYRESFHQYKTGPYLQYTREAHWRPEVRRLIEEYFPARTEAFLRIMARRGVPVPDDLTGVRSNR